MGNFNLIIKFFLFIIPPGLGSSEFYEFKYKILWNGVKVGYAYLGKYAILNYQSENCYLLQAKAFNLPVLQKLYPVKDKVTTYWSLKKRKPIYSEKELREGSYYRFQKSFFYYNIKQIHWYQREKVKNQYKNKRGVVEIQKESEIQDILSAIFYLHESPYRPKENQFSIPMFDDTQFTFLTINILKKEKFKIKINNEEFLKDVWMIKPYYQTSGLFRLAGDLTIWISDHEKQIVKIRAKIPYLGYVESILIEYKQW
ncbi:MAG: DUF3108 domain-containing protein [Leptonema sp. (in: bacteria)]